MLSNFKKGFQKSNEIKSLKHPNLSTILRSHPENKYDLFLFKLDKNSIRQKKAVDPFLSTVVHAAPLKRHHQIMKTN
jgi:hypothetical protein